MEKYKRYSKIFSVVVLAVFIAWGCADSSKPKEEDPPQKASRDSQPEKKKEESTPKAKKEEVNNPSQTVSGKKTSNKKYILVFITNELITKKDRESFLQASIDKWLKDKDYVQLSKEECYNSLAQYEGCIIYRIEIRRQYGTFEMNVRKGVVENQGDFYAESPLGYWRRPSESEAEFLIKEIKFADDLKKEPAKKE